MLAAAVGPPSSQTRSSAQPGPRSSSICSRTVWVGIGGAESWSLVSSVRYGAASSSGSAASSTLSACPNFIAPPLSSPSVRNSCSAVRCWISVSTVSAGAPPSRFPSPIAVRPAYPRGRAANRAVRAAALRGRSRSATAPLSLTPGYGVRAVRRERRPGGLVHRRGFRAFPPDVLAPLTHLTGRTHRPRRGADQSEGGAMYGTYEQNDQRAQLLEDVVDDSADTAEELVDDASGEA